MARKTREQVLLKVAGLGQGGFLTLNDLAVLTNTNRGRLLKWVEERKLSRNPPEAYSGNSDKTKYRFTRQAIEEVRQLKENDEKLKALTTDPNTSIPHRAPSDDPNEPSRPLTAPKTRRRTKVLDRVAELEKHLAAKDVQMLEMAKRMRELHERLKALEGD